MKQLCWRHRVVIMVLFVLVVGGVLLLVIERGGAQSTQVMPKDDAVSLQIAAVDVVRNTAVVALGNGRHALVSRGDMLPGTALQLGAVYAARVQLLGTNSHGQAEQFYLALGEDVRLHLDLVRRGRTVHYLQNVVTSQSID